MWQQNRGCKEMGLTSELLHSLTQWEFQPHIKWATIHSATCDDDIRRTYIKARHLVRK